MIATKYSAHCRAGNRESEPLQSNFVGNSAKSMLVSVRESLKKLETDYIDILYVHWYVFPWNRYIVLAVHWLTFSSIGGISLHLWKKS